MHTTTQHSTDSAEDFLLRRSRSLALSSLHQVQATGEQQREEGWRFPSVNWSPTPFLPFGKRSEGCFPSPRQCPTTGLRALVSARSVPAHGGERHTEGSGTRSIPAHRCPAWELARGGSPAAKNLGEASQRYRLRPPPHTRCPGRALPSLGAGRARAGPRGLRRPPRLRGPWERVRVPEAAGRAGTGPWPGVSLSPTPLLPSPPVPVRLQVPPRQLGGRRGMLPPPCPAPE